MGKFNAHLVIGVIEGIFIIVVVSMLSVSRAGSECVVASNPANIVLELRSCRSLPCKGSNLPFEIIVRNAGAEPFSRNIALNVSIDEYGAGKEIYTIDRFVDIPPGGADSLTCSFDVSFDCDSLLLEVGVDDDSNSYGGGNAAELFLYTSPGKLLVNEIMYRPESGFGEWLELFNNSGFPVNLEGWYMADATGRERLIADDRLVIAPYDYLILCQDIESFHLQYPQCSSPAAVPTGGWPRLNDSPSSINGGAYADVVEIFDHFGRLVESIRYSDLLSSKRGVSIERVSSELCSTGRIAIWQMSGSNGGATPGEANSITTSNLPSAGSVIIAPDRFDPKYGGTSITVSILPAETGCSVRIFDMNGMEVRRIIGISGSDRIFSCFWDGRSSSGTMVSTGVYICLVEFVGGGGVVCRRVKRPVIVFRR